MPCGSFTYSQCQCARHSTALLAALLTAITSFAYSRDGVHVIQQLYILLRLRARRAAALLTPITCLQARAQRATTLLTRMPARHVTGLLTRITCLQARRRARHADETRLRRAPARPSACRAAQIPLANQV